MPMYETDDVAGVYYDEGQEIRLVEHIGEFESEEVRPLDAVEVTLALAKKKGPVGDRTTAVSMMLGADAGSSADDDDDDGVGGDDGDEMVETILG